MRVPSTVTMAAWSTRRESELLDAENVGDRGDKPQCAGGEYQREAGPPRLGGNGGDRLPVPPNQPETYWHDDVTRARTSPSVIQIATIEATVGQYTARMPSTARPAASTGATRHVAARHRGGSIGRSSCTRVRRFSHRVPRALTRASLPTFAGRVRAPSDQTAYPLCGVSHVYPRLRVNIGPSALTSGRGSRFQIATSVRYFGLSGLFCGIAVPLRNRYSYPAAVPARTPSSSSKSNDPVPRRLLRP